MGEDGGFKVDNIGVMSLDLIGNSVSFFIQRIDPQTRLWFRNRFIKNNSKVVVALELRSDVGLLSEDAMKNGGGQ